MLNIVKDCKIDPVNDAIALADNTDDNSDILDMAGFEGVMFIATVTDSVATGVATLTVQQNSTSSDTGMTGITGGSAQLTCVTSDDLNGKILVVDCYRPTMRYVQGTLTSATANIAFGETIAFRYGARKMPITQGDDTEETFVVGNE